MPHKSFLFAGVSLAIAALPSLALAQTAADPPAIDEVIVTATLRAENLQDVPIAVTALTSDTLERAGIKDLRNLDQLSPSFNMNSSQTESGGATLRIRGVGTTGNNTGLESAVAIFLDGVYISRPGIALGDLLDVEQIELLRGPQGTLFGRNTSSGALNIKTKRPSLDAFEGFANATYGNYDLMNVQAGISGPIMTGSMGFRLSGAWRERDGYIENAAGGESLDADRYIVRGQLYWEPTAELSARLIVDHSKSDERCCDAIVIRESSYVNGAYAANGLPANGGVSVSGPGAVDDRKSANDSEFSDKIKQTGVSLQVDYDLGENADFVWISGWRKSRAESRQESDFVGVDVFSTSNNTSTTTPNSPESFTEITTITQEVRLSGTLGTRIDYLVGGYYADEEIREIQSLTLGVDHQAYISAALTSVGVPGPNSARNIFAGGVSSAGNFAANHFKQDGRNYSFFTNNTIHFTERLALNFGARYSNDRKHGEFDQLAAFSPACAAVIARTPLLPAALQPLAPLARALTCFPFATQVGQGPNEFDRVFKDENFIYTVKLLGDITEDINAYVSFSHGYKAGGFNLDPTAAAGVADPRFDSEKVDAYELGVKSQLFDRRLTANLAVFHQDLSDFQVLEFTGVQFQTFNVPKAKSTGFELELNGRVTEELFLNGSVTYADARYPNDCGGATPPATVALLCGNKLTNAPEWVLVGGVSYDRDLGNGLEMAFNANIRWEDDRRTSTQATTVVAAGTGTFGPTNNFILSPNDIQDSNAKVNLRVALGATDKRWRVEVWGNNIFDEQTYHVVANTPLRGVSSIPGPLNAGGASLSRIAFLQEPRTYGITVRTEF